MNNKLDPTTLLGATSVVRQWGDVFDGFDRKAGGLQRGYGAFATATRTVHLNVYFLHAEFDSFFRCLLSSQLPGKRRALATALKTTRSRSGPTQCIAFGVGDGDRRIVKGRLDMGDPDGHASTCLASLWLRFGHGMRCS